MEINEPVKNKTSGTVPEELLLENKFEIDVKELIVNINKNEEGESFLLSSDDRIKDVNLIVRDSHHEKREVDLDINEKTEDVNEINIVDLVSKEGEHEKITREVNKDNHAETITVAVHDKVEEVNVLFSNKENEIKEIHLQLRNEGEDVKEIHLELTDVEKVDVTKVETVKFVEDEGRKIVESVSSESEIKVVDNKNKNIEPKENVKKNGQHLDKEEHLDKANLPNLEILKNIEEDNCIKIENIVNDKSVINSNRASTQSTSDDNKDTKEMKNSEQNKLNDLSLQSAKSLESKVVWETVLETQKDVDVVDTVKDERKEQETDLDEDDYFGRHNDVFLDDYYKVSTSSFGDAHGEMWQDDKSKLLSPTDNTDPDVWNNGGGREKSVFLSFLEDRQKQKALSISDLNNKDTIPLYDELKPATGGYLSAQAPPIPPPPASLVTPATAKQHTCGSLFSHCIAANHNDTLVQTFSKQRNQQVPPTTNSAKPFVDDAYTGPVSLTEIIQEREQNAKYHPNFSYKKKYSPSNATSENYCNKTWSDWGVIGAGKHVVAIKPENIRMCKFEETDEDKLDKRLLMGNGASTPGQIKNRTTNGLCGNQSSNVSAIDVNHHLEYVNEGVVPVLKRELREWELKATDLNSEVIVLRREVKRKEQEIFRLQREVHKLKSVLQQATSFSQDGSPDLLSSLQDKHGMAGQITGTNNKKQGVSAESSQPNKTATDIQIQKYDKDFRSKQLIKDAIMDNDFLKNLDLSQVREIVESMYPKECAKGSYLIREGEAGAHLYVSAEGEFEVIKDNKVLGRMGAGKAFGELAILYNCTRTASIRVVKDSKVWVLDRRVFQRIMMRTGLQRLEDNVSFLQSVPLLQNLPVDILAKISDALQVEFYPTGHHIIRQGASGDSFFILSQGSVKVTQRLPGSSEEQELRILERGDYFGEQALLKEECRTASIIAMPPGVECLTLDRESFIQLIGDLSELKEKEYSDLPRPPSVVSVHEQSTGDQELDSIRLDDLDVIATLGVGGFGRVELVQCLHDKSRTFALKCMKKQHIVETHQQEHVYSEKDIMMSCRHPFICRLYKTFKDSKYVYMLLEACLGGEVWTILRDRGCFDDATACFITSCVVEALDYLHSRGIVFRDLKPENLLLDAQGYVKLVDFGFAKRLGFHSNKTWTFCGTPEYVAPEIILNKGHDRAVDIWALGILMHELLTGAPPFSGTDMKVYNMILKGIDMIDFPRHVTKTAQALVKRLCRESPSERLGCQKGGLADIKKHKWFQGFDWEGLRQRTLTPPIIPQVRGCTDISNFDQYSKDNNIPPDENSNWDEDF